MTIHKPTELALAEVLPGAILAAPVLGVDGQTLMAAGSTLSEAVLVKLAERGVETVTIEVQRDEAELSAERDAVRQRLEHMFRACDIEDANDPAGILFAAVLNYRLETLQ